MSLEQIIIQREKRQKQTKDKQQKKESKIEALRIKEEKQIFRRDIKVLFNKFLKETKVIFDKYNHRHAIFFYQKEKYSIAYEKWLIEGTGVDGYDISGERWALHKWVGGWPGEGHCIVNKTDIKLETDYSNKSIELLAEISKEK